MACIKINGRTHFVNASEVTVETTGNGRFTVHYDDRDLEVLGGTKSGGSAREWFYRNEPIFGDRWLPCTSFAEAIRLGVQF